MLYALKTYPRHGFTLIEISIVLTIIALVAGGILAGKALIEGAALRAQVSQIEEYQRAIVAFRLKFEALPGDIAARKATSIGLVTRTGGQGRGDNSGLLQDVGKLIGTYFAANELALFWRDLSETDLIGQTFTTAIDSTNGTGDWPNPLSPSTINALLPQAKIGQGNYIGVWSGGYTGVAGGILPTNGKNYMVLTIPTYINGGNVQTAPGLKPLQARDIDLKIDDGLPQAGKVTAIAPYAAYGLWSSGNSGAPNGGLIGAAIAAGTTSCYDNGNTAGQVAEYTTRLSQTVYTCSLSVELQ